MDYALFGMTVITTIAWLAQRSGNNQEPARIFRLVFFGVVAMLLIIYIPWGGIVDAALWLNGYGWLMLFVLTCAITGFVLLRWNEGIQSGIRHAAKRTREYLMAPPLDVRHYPQNWDSATDIEKGDYKQPHEYTSQGEVGDYRDYNRKANNRKRAINYTAGAVFFIGLAWFSKEIYHEDGWVVLLRTIAVTVSYWMTLQMLWTEPVLRPIGTLPEHIEETEEDYDGPDPYGGAPG